MEKSINVIEKGGGGGGVRKMCVVNSKDIYFELISSMITTKNLEPTANILIMVRWCKCEQLSITLLRLPSTRQITFS